MVTMLIDAVFSGLSWNPVEDVRRLLTYPFMVHALEAGTAVAVMAGVIGWFMVLRRQTFAGHTLAATAFTGASAAGLAGIPVAIGYFGACGLGALALGYFGFCGLGAVVLALIAGSSRSYSSESAATGTVQAFALGLGFLFVALYHGILNGLDSLLFGTFLGITSSQVETLVVVAAVSVAVVGVASRPLLYASVDPDVAGAGGVPVRLLGLGFLFVLGLSVAEASQITGALLVFALLVTPAATAQQITARPVAGVMLSVALALTVTWLGLALAYFSIYPVGFYITSIAFGLYALTRLVRAFT